MISQVKGTIGNAYTQSSLESKESQKGATTISKQGDMSKVEKIKESLQSGEYKVDLQALSEKIADELL